MRDTPGKRRPPRPAALPARPWPQAALECYSFHPPSLLMIKVFDPSMQILFVSFFCSGPKAAHLLPSHLTCLRVSQQALNFQKALAPRAAVNKRRILPEQQFPIRRRVGLPLRSGQCHRNGARFHDLVQTKAIEVKTADRTNAKNRPKQPAPVFHEGKTVRGIKPAIKVNAVGAHLLKHLKRNGSFASPKATSEDPTKRTLKHRQVRRFRSSVALPKAILVS